MDAEAIEILRRAELEARERGFSHIGTESLLVGLLRDSESWTAELMAEHGLTLEHARKQIATRVGSGPGIPASQPVPLTPRAGDVLDRARTEAIAHSNGQVRAEHVVLAVIEVDEGEGINALRGAGVRLADVRNTIIDRLRRED
jgi:ATP-dependent Clp protease ATP-binding subunit ClpA